MKKIGWIQISSRRYGGVIYGEQVRKVLSKNFNLDLINIEAKHLRWRYLKAPEIFSNLIRLKGQRSLWIRDFYPIVTLSLDKTRGKNLATVYHIDFSLESKFLKPIYSLLEKAIYYNLKKTDAIVTLSDYWKNHFLKRGYKNVYKIYPGFDLTKFNITDQETQEFKRKFNLEGKPVIYIGNCQEGKGVVQAYQALKELDVYLVSSGEPLARIPALNLNLSYPDYLRLLKASSIVVTMSKFKEGWCMTSHEAMLLKTPVIGSGLGGMRELLEGGKQIICPGFNSLRERVEYLLAHPEIRTKMGENGYNFAKNFSQERFEKEWLNLIKKLTG